MKAAPLLQVAMDYTSLSKALVMAALVAPEVDIIEIGTPLCKAAGLEAIRAMREVCPDKLILADFKTPDVGGLEANMAFDAGADMMTVIGGAAMPTVEQALSVARQRGKEILMELTGVRDILARAVEWRQIGVDRIVYHREWDAQSAGREWTEDDKDIMRKLIELGYKVTVTGGMTMDLLPFFADLPVSVLICGRGIREAPDPRASARQMRLALTELWAGSSSKPAKMTVARLQRKKRNGEKITLLTAYDFPMAKFIDAAGVDVVLVSDTVGTVGLGRSEAVSVSVDEMVHHTQAVARGAGSAMVVTTMPFGAYETVEQAVSNGVRLMKEGHADGIHMKAAAADAPKVKALIHAGVPVLGHLGITKQKIVRTGAIQIQGRTAASAASAVTDAVSLANAGAFALILECIPDRLGEIITRSLDIPTIGIGAGPGCDGQALVTQDMLGMFKEMSPRFLKVYLDLTQIIEDALTQFRTEVEQGQFPGPEHCYAIEDDELGKLLTQLQSKVLQEP